LKVLEKICRYATQITALLGLILYTSRAAAFDSSSGRVERIDERIFSVQLQNDNGRDDLPDAWRTWWYVELPDVSTTAATQVNVARLGQPYPYVPFFSYDQRHWQRFEPGEVELSSADTLTLRHPFDRSPVWLAQREPYSADQLDLLLADLRRTAACRSDIGLKIESLGESPQGRPLQMITLTDRSTDPISQKPGDLAKHRVWVHARVHPNQTQSSWMADGLLRFLSSDERAAQAARRRFIFHVVPLVNVDGVAMGHTRTDASGQNIEPLWDVDRPPTEIALLKNRAAALQLAGPGFRVALNLHASHAPQDQPAFAYAPFGPTEMGYSHEEASLWTRHHHFCAAVAAAIAPRPFDAVEPAAESVKPPIRAGTGFLQKAYPERWWWRRHGAQVMSLTVEAVDGKVGVDDGWFSADDARDLGRALVLGILAEDALAIPDMARRSNPALGGRSRRDPVKSCDFGH
jgi:hypothetical protein